MSENSEKLFVNIYDYADPRYPFQFFVGGRGIGKSYSAFLPIAKGLPIVPGEDCFPILVRRTDEEIKTMSDSAKNGAEGGNPFFKINTDQGTNVGIQKVAGKIFGMYNRHKNDDGTYSAEGAPLGYCMSLSAIGSTRGLSMENVTDYIFDEFIPQASVTQRDNEGDNFLNSYETIARNREILGKKPLRVWAMSNAMKLNNPLFRDLNLIRPLEKMLAAGKSDLYLPERGLAVHLLKTPPKLAKLKANTALYKLTAGTKFSSMALDNAFSYDDFSNIMYIDVKGYKPIIALDSAVVYVKKSPDYAYISYRDDPSIQHLQSTKKGDQKYFMRKAGLALNEYIINNRIRYESFELKSLIESIVM